MSFTSYIPALSADLDELPNICFTKDAPGFTEAVNCIGEAIELRTNKVDENTDDSRARVITTQVANQLEQLVTCPECGRHLEALTNIGNSIAEKVGNVFNILKYTIHPEVESLKESIQNAVETELLQAQDLESISVVTGDTTTPVGTEVTSFDWDLALTSGFDAQTVVDAMSAMMGYSITPQMSSLSALLSAKAPTAITTVQIAPDSAADVIRRWGVSGTATSDVDYQHVYELVTDNYVYQSEITALFHTLNTSNDFGHLVDTISQTIKMGDRYLPLISVPLDLPADVLNTLRGNIETLRSAMIALSFALLCLRANYSNAFIINEHYANHDLVEQAKSAGITNQDAEKYVLLYHVTPGIPVPASGISLLVVADNKAATDAKLAEHKAATQLQVNTLKLNATIRAARDVLTTYLQSTDPSRLPENMHVNEFVDMRKGLIETLITRLNSSEDNNLESLLYEFVINCHYPDSMVATAHRMLGDEVVKQLRLDPEAEASNLAICDVAVATRLAASFIMANLNCLDTVTQ